jgi:hypothetical protein
MKPTRHDPLRISTGIAVKVIRAVTFAVALISTPSDATGHFLWKKDTYEYNSSGVESVTLAQPVLVDLDSDGDKDLVIGQDEGPLAYYENTGTPARPRWIEDSEMFHREHCEVSRSAPAFADLDGDGDMDLAAGEFNGRIKGYRNTGSPSRPSWEPDSTLFADIRVGSFTSAPSFCDLDGDGDADLIVGERDEFLSFYENTGTQYIPEWTFRPEMFDTLYFGYFTVPSLADIDADSDYDLLVGNRSGDLRYFYRNTGTVHLPKWRFEPDVFADIRVDWMSAPCLSDLDIDGDADLVIGDEDGKLYCYFNTGSPSVPEYTFDVSIFDGIDAGFYSMPAPGDLDGDGDGDLLIGHSDTTLLYYVRQSSDPPVWIPDPLTFSEIITSGMSAPHLHDADNDSDLDLILGDASGGLHYYENTGGSQYPFWERRESPVERIDVGSHSAPSAGDIDGDGDPDLLIGELDGNLNLALNTGSISSPRWSIVDTCYQQIEITAFRSTPFLADFDRDGDLDLAVGMNVGMGYDIAAYENRGTPEHASFVFNPHVFETLSIGLYTAPVLFDSDRDGDLDLSCGEYSGNITYFENTEFHHAALPAPDGTAGGSETAHVPKKKTADSLTLSVSPNPSNSHFTIRMDVSGNDHATGAAQASLRIYDTRGAAVARIWKGTVTTGGYHWRWNGRNGRGERLPSGVYMVRLSWGELCREQRIMLLN